MHGDITAIYSHAGLKLVSYTYDAWGNFTTTYHNGGASTKAADNPFTYRGYYYDKSLGFFYLGTRYYDAKICRFINADKVMSGVNESLDGYNLFVYCFNDPINMTDAEGDWPKWLKKAVQKVVETVKEVAYSAYYNATEWHFEERERRNGEHPTYDAVEDEEDGWSLVSGKQTVYHDNKVGEPEMKYTNIDGREAVFDGDTLDPMTDQRYIATFNYCPVHQIPKNGETVLDYVKFAYTGVGHVVVDVLPYYITGMSNTREQFESKIGIFN